MVLSITDQQLSAWPHSTPESLGTGGWPHRHRNETICALHRSLCYHPGEQEFVKWPPFPGTGTGTDSPESAYLLHSLCIPCSCQPSKEGTYIDSVGSMSEWWVSYTTVSLPVNMNYLNAICLDWLS